MKLTPLLKEITAKYADDVDIIHKSPNLVVLAPKTSNVASKYSHNTNWCSQTKIGFCIHRATEVLFRFFFKDGYKLRLNVRDNGLVGHWGGPVENNNSDYPVIQFKRNPQNINQTQYKDKLYRNMINHITSIPKDVIQKVIDYTNQNILKESDAMKKVTDYILSLKNKYNRLHFSIFSVEYDEKEKDLIKKIIIYRQHTSIKLQLDNNGTLTKDGKTVSLKTLSSWCSQLTKTTIKGDIEFIKEACEEVGWVCNLESERIVILNKNELILTIIIKNNQFYINNERVERPDIIDTLRKIYYKMR